MRQLCQRRLSLRQSLLSLAVLLFVASIAVAQSPAALTGQVQADSQAPLAGVEITLSDGSVAVTDEAGQYCLDNLVRGETYLVRASKPGYDFSPAEKQMVLGAATQALNFVAVAVEAMDAAAGAGGSLLTSSTVKPALTPMDAYEPDDSSGTASPVASGVVQNRSFHLPTNPDWATFTLIGPADVTIETDGASGDTQMWLYRSTGTQVEFDDDDGNGSFSLIQRTGATALAAGTYYIRIQNALVSATYAYTLSLTAAYTIAPDVYEVDDASSTAKTIWAGQTQNRTIHAAGNVDWAKFTLAGPADVTVETSGITGDTQMWLYNSAGTFIEYDDDDGAGLFSRIERSGANALAAGTYYVKVQKWGNNGVIAAYTLSLTVVSQVATDIYEPDDSSATAKTISGGQTQNRTIHAPGNVDWAKFTLAAPADVTISTDGPAGDTQMWLYSATGTLIEFDDDDGNGLFSYIARTGASALPAGTYLIKVQEFGNNGLIPSYTLSLTVASLASMDAYEADNTSGTAKTIDPGTSQDRTIHAPGNVDWAKFTLAAPSDVSIWTNGATGDTEMWLYSGSGTMIEYDDDDGNGAFSQIQRTGGSSLPSGTYYIKVQEKGNDGIITAYTLSLSVTPLASPDAWEPDNTSATASELLSGVAQNHTIHVGTDSDWARFTLATTSAITLWTDGLSGDTLMWLYNTGGTLVEFDDDDGAGAFSAIERSGANVLSAGTYYVRVADFGFNSVIASYTLNLTITPVP